MPPSPPPRHFPSPFELPATFPSHAAHVVMADGARIAAFVYGSLDTAPAPVLMLHGNGEEHGIFGPTIDAVVRAGMPVVALDARAQGRSTRGTLPLTYELMAADALAVLDALGVAAAHVLGFSDGGIEGLLLARDHADRVLSSRRSARTSARRASSRTTSGTSGAPWRHIVPGQLSRTGPHRPRWTSPCSPPRHRRRS